MGLEESAPKRLRRLQAPNLAKCVCARAHARAFALPTGGAAVAVSPSVLFFRPRDGRHRALVDIADKVVDICVKGADAGASYGPTHLKWKGGVGEKYS